MLEERDVASLRRLPGKILEARAVAEDAKREVAAVNKATLASLQELERRLEAETAARVAAETRLDAIEKVLASLDEEEPAEPVVSSPPAPIAVPAPSAPPAPPSS